MDIRTWLVVAFLPAKNYGTVENDDDDQREKE